MPEWFNTIVAVPVVVKALQLVVLALLFLAARSVARMVRRQVERRLAAAVLDADRRHRLQTLHRVGYGAAITVLAALALVMGLQVVGLPIGPLLGSAGVVGLAISLGAQTLIRDYLGGIFILAEDQFRVGDQVTVAGVTGEVVRMTMRVSYLRDVDGKLHTVPNGDIRLISNHTREWSRAVVDLNLDYGIDMAAAQRALQMAIARLLSDEAVKDLVIGQPDVMTWNNLSDWAVQVRLLARTLPGKQWKVGQALRQVAVEALREAGYVVGPGVPVWREGGKSDAA
jgi:small conductance mechanosensitive channel